LRKLTQWNIVKAVKVIKEELLSRRFTGAEPSSVLGRGGALISPLARGAKGPQPFYGKGRGLATLEHRRGPLIDPRGRSLKRCFGSERTLVSPGRGKWPSSTWKKEGTLFNPAGMRSEGPVPVPLNTLIGNGSISNPQGSRGPCRKEGEGPLPALVKWTLTFQMEKENDIFNLLRREGRFVKPVIKEEAVVIHQEKKGNFTIHVGYSGKKEGPVAEA
jgi:hypothetical protein